MLAWRTERRILLPRGEFGRTRPAVAFAEPFDFRDTLNVSRMSVSGLT